MVHPETRASATVKSRRNLQGPGTQSACGAERELACTTNKQGSWGGRQLRFSMSWEQSAGIKLDYTYVKCHIFWATSQNPRTQASFPRLVLDSPICQRFADILIPHLWRKHRTISNPWKLTQLSRFNYPDSHRKARKNLAFWPHMMAKAKGCCTLRARREFINSWFQAGQWTWWRNGPASTFLRGQEPFEIAAKSPRDECN